ncbi:LicD family protein [Candidatus Hepatoplasma crinochetorum]|uniref:LicD family protein n=1 Tax=Candidatus Hepatoplasma crinochetorum Av TaxID=1427984 RepID=W8GRV6_9MOLU|nr:LicD family protein [Candidatus Hepatoplasma crinochetorum]AHK22170.1 LicD family protein [Candidatus Hepatoplasma crinochetorum Av]BDV02756.1 MAG: hypothetical protein HCTKY_0500 [Candidatus Hepatoplasma crinochetorum]
MKKISFEEFQKLNFEGFKKINEKILQNNIKWWAHSGSLLGFIRDKKLISWDDDIDMGMRLYDFKKNFQLLSKIANEENYKLIDRLDYFGLDVARFIYKEKYIIEYKGKEYISSPYIDVMMGVSSKNNNLLKRKLWSWTNNYLFIFNSFWKPLPYFGWKFNKVKKIHWYEQFSVFIVRIILFPLFLALPLQNLWLKHKSKDKSDKVSFYYNYDNLGIIYDVNKLQEKKINDFKILVNDNYLEELNLRFKEWKILPSKEKQIPHHIFLTPNLNKYKNKYKIDPFIIK